MTSSAAYALDPTVASFTEEAWERIGRDPAKLTVEQLRSTRRSMNLLLSDWANLGSREWAISTDNQILTQGTVEYSVAAGTMDILTMVLRRNGVDTPVYQMSREEYLMIPSKTQQGMPTRFQFNRLIGTQTYKLWNAPENSTDYVYFNRLRRLQDVTTAAETLDLNYAWFEAFASGLACKLAIKFAPDRYALLKREAAEMFKHAQDNEREQGVDTQMTMTRGR